MAGEWEDHMGEALKEIAGQIAPLETEWDAEKLEKKLREYFRKAAKAVEKWSSWDKMVTDYCDAAFSSIFSSLGDREWLQQADFLLAIDAGLKETIPKKVLEKVPKEDFEKHVLMSYEKSWEYQRFSPICWEATKEFVTGPKTTSKVRTAFEEGREEAAAAAVDGEGPDAWVERWVDASIRKLAEVTSGYPGGTLEADTCKQYVARIIENGGVPPALVVEVGPDMGLLELAVNNAYEKYSAKEGEANPFEGGGKKKAKAAWEPAADPWGAAAAYGMPAWGMMKGAGKGWGGAAAWGGKGGGKWGPY